MEGEGTFANVLEGIDFAAQLHAAKYSNYPGILNLSLGGAADPIMD